MNVKERQLNVTQNDQSQVNELVGELLNLSMGLSYRGKLACFIFFNICNKAYEKGDITKQHELALLKAGVLQMKPSEFPCDPEDLDEPLFNDQAMDDIQEAMLSDHESEYNLTNWVGVSLSKHFRSAMEWKDEFVSVPCHFYSDLALIDLLRRDYKYDTQNMVFIERPKPPQTIIDGKVMKWGRKAP